MLIESQQHFILCFIGDGDYDFNATCSQLGIRPSIAARWFASGEFQKALKGAEMAQLARMGYGPLLAMRDTLAIAHSDITKIIGLEEDDMNIAALNELPRQVRVAIKSIEFGSTLTIDGQVKIYPKKITMHDKMAALQRVSEWYAVAEHEATKGADKSADGPKRITGLVVRPPVSADIAEGEKMLEE